MIKEQKTIVLIGNHYIVIYNFRKELIQKLKSEGYRVVVLMPYTQEAEKITQLGCEVIDVPVDRRGINPIKDIKLFIQYKKYLKTIRPDMVLTYTIKPNIYGGFACRILKIPYICTITGLGKGIEEGGILKRMILTMYQVALKRVQMIFFQNAENKILFEKAHIGKNKYTLVNGSGVNLDTFSFKAFPPENDPIRFIYMARITKSKGVDELLEAICAIKEKYENVEFHFLGFMEEDYTDIFTKYRENGLIIYHGMQMEVISYLEKCQCLLLPSWFEGMSNACLEAAAIGRAVITSDISGCRECVEDGVTGFLHKPNDSKDLTEKIEKFLSMSYNDRKQMGESGRRKMEKEFSRQLVVDAYMKEITK